MKMVEKHNMRMRRRTKDDETENNNTDETEIAPENNKTVEKQYNNAVTAVPNCANGIDNCLVQGEACPNWVAKKKKYGNNELDPCNNGCALSHLEIVAQPNESMSSAPIDPTEAPSDAKPRYQQGLVGDNAGLAGSIILLVAAGCCSVFEGLSLGLQETEQGVWDLTIAILSHEVLLGFSLGIKLCRCITPIRVFLFAIAYGLMTPLGISVGVAIMESQGSDTGDDVTIASAVLIALTGGVFLYVTFFEILNGEISANSHIAKHIAALCGFALMALISLVPHEHGHGHGHDDHGHDEHGHNASLGVLKLVGPPGYD